MLAHDGDRLAASLVGQLQASIVSNVDEAVPLHSGHRLADRGAALVEPFGDAGAEGDDPLLFELIHGPQVHLGRVYELAVVTHERLSFTVAAHIVEP
jgi:hypothetical protein